LHKHNYYTRIVFIVPGTKTTVFDIILAVLVRSHKAK
jgi:hypothetical protein